MTKQEILGILNVLKVVFENYMFENKCVRKLYVNFSDEQADLKTTGSSS